MVSCYGGCKLYFGFGYVCVFLDMYCIFCYCYYVDFF